MKYAIVILALIIATMIFAFIYSGNHPVESAQQDSFSVQTSIIINGRNCQSTRTILQQGMVQEIKVSCQK